MTQVKDLAPDDEVTDQMDADGEHPGDGPGEVEDQQGTELLEDGEDPDNSWNRQAPARARVGRME